MKGYALLLLILSACTDIPIEMPSIQRRVIIIDSSMAKSPDTLTVHLPYEEPAFKVIAYATSWSDLKAKDIRYSLLTHINYCFLLPQANGGIKLGDIHIQEMMDLIQRAHQNHVRVFISIGGWDIGDGGGVDTKFERMVANPKAVNKFVQNVSDFLLKYNLDGADIDWEYPDDATFRGFGQTKKSSEYFLEMLKQLQVQLKTNNKALTIAVISQGDSQGSGILKEVFDVVDWVNVMAYDAPFPHHSTYALAEQCWDYWINQRGMNPSKFVLGLPFYGKFPWKTYKDLIAENARNDKRDYYRTTDYNGIPTIQKKTRFVLDRGGRGVMFWELAGDTSDKTSLLAAINAEVEEELSKKQ